MSMDKIKQLLNIKSSGEFKRGNIWKVIDEEVITYPCYKPCVTLINNKNDCGVNFSGDRTVCKLFSTDDTEYDDTYYPAIWIGNGNLERIDEYPIYILDYDDFEEGTELKYVGNFRSYIEKILTDFLDQYNKGTEDEYIKTAEIMLKELSSFSEVVIDKGNYRPILC